MSTLPIILDKSTFQGFSFEEIIELHKYYLINITPTLVMEILGDLSKEEKEGKKPVKEKVIQLAKKIFPHNSHVNMPFQSLIVHSLKGQDVELSNRPLLNASKSVVSPGKKGLVFEETAEELAIRRWKDGEFSTSDEVISHIWRQKTKEIENIESFKKIFQPLSQIKLSKSSGDTFSDLVELKKSLDVIIDNPKEQKNLLKCLIEFFNIEPNLASEIFYRWDSNGFQKIEEFAPYAFFCFKIAAMYFVGLNNKLLGDRITNLIDMQYLYYTPFSRVFSTNDKFLITLFNLICPINVTLLSLEKLKEDFGKLKTTQPKTGGLPAIESTETFKVWEKTYDISNPKPKPIEKDLERAKREFDEIIKLAESGNQGKFEGEPDFVVKKRYVKLTDPCICGSGKPLGECCYTIDKRQ